MTASEIKEKGQMEVKTIAVAVLGGAFDAEELGDNDILPDSDLLEKMQQDLVTGYDDVHIKLIDRTHFDRLTAELAALQSRLNETDAENDRLRAMLSMASKGILRHQAEQPMSLRIARSLTKIRTDIKKALENKHEQQ